MAPRRADARGVGELRAAGRGFGQALAELPGGGECKAAARLPESLGGFFPGVQSAGAPAVVKDWLPPWIEIYENTCNHSESSACPFGEWRLGSTCKQKNRLPGTAHHHPPHPKLPVGPRQSPLHSLRCSIGRAWSAFPASFPPAGRSQPARDGWTALWAAAGQSGQDAGPTHSRAGKARHVPSVSPSARQDRTGPGLSLAPNRRAFPASPV